MFDRQEKKESTFDIPSFEIVEANDELQVKLSNQEAAQINIKNKKHLTQLVQLILLAILSTANQTNESQAELDELVPGIKAATNNITLHFQSSGYLMHGFKIGQNTTLVTECHIRTHIASIQGCPYSAEELKSKVDSALNNTSNDQKQGIIENIERAAKYNNLQVGFNHVPDVLATITVGNDENQELAQKKLSTTENYIHNRNAHDSLKKIINSHRNRLASADKLKEKIEANNQKPFNMKRAAWGAVLYLAYWCYGGERNAMKFKVLYNLADHFDKNPLIHSVEKALQNVYITDEGVLNAKAALFAGRCSRIKRDLAQKPEPTLKSMAFSRSPITA